MAVGLVAEELAVVELIAEWLSDVRLAAGELTIELVADWLTPWGLIAEELVAACFAAELPVVVLPDEFVVEGFAMKIVASVIGIRMFAVAGGLTAGMLAAVRCVLSRTAAVNTDLMVIVG